MFNISFPCIQSPSHRSISEENPTQETSIAPRITHASCFMEQPSQPKTSTKKSLWRYCTFRHFKKARENGQHFVKTGKAVVEEVNKMAGICAEPNGIFDQTKAIAQESLEALKALEQPLLDAHQQTRHLRKSYLHHEASNLLAQSIATTVIGLIAYDYQHKAQDWSLLPSLLSICALASAVNIGYKIHLLNDIRTTSKDLKRNVYSIFEQVNKAAKDLSPRVQILSSYSSNFLFAIQSIAKQAKEDIGVDIFYDARESF